MYLVIFFQILMHILLEIQRSTDNGHTFVAKWQVHLETAVKLMQAQFSNG